MLPPSQTSPQASGPYDLFMLGLSAYALLALGASVALNLSAGTTAVLGYADVGVCGFFFVDFLVQVRRAPDRLRYLLSWGWLDLASSVPFMDAFRLGRLGRVFRILRVLRGARSAKNLAAYVLARRAQGTFLAVSLLALLLLVFASVAVLHFEAGGNGSIKTAEEALWWSFATITTVGYGDYYPVSSEGRVVGVLLMTAGVGLFATFSGFIASWFIAPQEAEQKNELQALRADIAVLKDFLERRAAQPPSSR